MCWHIQTHCVCVSFAFISHMASSKWPQTDENTSFLFIDQSMPVPKCPQLKAQAVTLVEIEKLQQEWAQRDQAAAEAKAWAGTKHHIKQVLGSITAAGYETLYAFVDELLNVHDQQFSSRVSKVSLTFIVSHQLFNWISIGTHNCDLHACTDMQWALEQVPNNYVHLFTCMWCVSDPVWCSQPHWLYPVLHCSNLKNKRPRSGEAAQDHWSSWPTSVYGYMGQPQYCLSSNISQRWNTCLCPFSDLLKGLSHLQWLWCCWDGNLGPVIHLAWRFSGG